MLREFGKRARYFLLGDQFINSHNLISCILWIWSGENGCWSSLGLKVHLHDHTTGFHQDTQKLVFCFLPLRFLGLSHQATLYSCFVLNPSMRKSEKGFSSNYENCRTTLPSCHVKERRSSNRLKSCRWSMNLCELQ